MVIGITSREETLISIIIDTRLVMVIIVFIVMMTFIMVGPRTIAYLVLAYLALGKFYVEPAAPEFGVVEGFDGSLGLGFRGKGDKGERFLSLFDD